MILVPGSMPKITLSLNGSEIFFKAKKYIRQLKIHLYRAIILYFGKYMKLFSRSLNLFILRNSKSLENDDHPKRKFDVELK